MGVGILGGAFDPPHDGHVALALAAIDHFQLERLLVRVVAAPGHKGVASTAADRLALAEMAFADVPGAEIELDRHARTVDSLEALGLDDPVFLVGADELAAFPEWKEPQRVLELARLGVATRPGYTPDVLEGVLARIPRRDRVELFALEPHDVSSSDLRQRVAAGLPLDSLHLPGIAEEIERRGLYRGSAGLH